MATETRRTDWIAYGHYGFAAYRIWHRKSDLGYQQRHEWKRDDGSIDCDEWINAYGSTSFDRLGAERTVTSEAA